MSDASDDLADEEACVLSTDGHAFHHNRCVRCGAERESPPKSDDFHFVNHDDRGMPHRADQCAQYGCERS